MPKIDPDTLDGLGDRIKENVGSVLNDANQHLPELRKLDQPLYSAVDPSLAVTYTLGTGYMNAMLQGALECFQALNDDLAATAQSWRDADGAAEQSFK
ncbi:hypothetical protein [Glycomyces sp. NPDC047010]|uniref:hypothetical protein n=1 Tax=Glycomyces sp. NPDC047010 TaxID=3155023 RepID=UPI0033FE67A5